MPMTIKMIIVVKEGCSLDNNWDSFEALEIVERRRRRLEERLSLAEARLRGLEARLQGLEAVAASLEGQTATTTPEQAA